MDKGTSLWADVVKQGEQQRMRIERRCWRYQEREVHKK